MHLTPFELLEVSAAIVAVLMLGSTNVRVNLALFAFQCLGLCAITVCVGTMRGDQSLLWLAVMVVLVKAIIAPMFLAWIMARIKVQAESKTFIPAPVSMHFGIILLALSYVLALHLPNLVNANDASMGSTASLGLLFMGMLMMVSRKLAINQVIGFLVFENGIFLFSLTQTRDMPLIVEMGILLDVLVGVMIAGLLLFRIQKSFEHIDVTQLTHLKD